MTTAARAAYALCLVATLASALLVLGASPGAVLSLPASGAAWVAMPASALLAWATLALAAPGGPRVVARSPHARALFASALAMGACALVAVSPLQLAHFGWALALLVVLVSVMTLAFAIAMVSGVGAMALLDEAAAAGEAVDDALATVAR